MDHRCTRCENFSSLHLCPFPLYIYENIDRQVGGKASPIYFVKFACTLVCPETFERNARAKPKKRQSESQGKLRTFYENGDRPEVFTDRRARTDLIRWQNPDRLVITEFSVTKIFNFPKKKATKSCKSRKFIKETFFFYINFNFNFGFGNFGNDFITGALVRWLACLLLNQSTGTSRVRFPCSSSFQAEQNMGLAPDSSEFRNVRYNALVEGENEFGKKKKNSWLTRAHAGPQWSEMMRACDHPPCRRAWRSRCPGQRDARFSGTPTGGFPRSSWSRSSYPETDEINHYFWHN